MNIVENHDGMSALTPRRKKPEEILCGLMDQLQHNLREMIPDSTIIIGSDDFEILIDHFKECSPMLFPQSQWEGANDRAIRGEQPTHPGTLFGKECVTIPSSVYSGEPRIV
jgi:hypothetical protein